MTATERLRALLDERGLEWKDIGLYQTVTAWESGALIWCAIDKGDHLTVEAPTTPEQAVEATLGRGTCRKVRREDATDAFDRWVDGCSECGAQLDGIYGRYCPNCGRRVVSA